jgi:putative transposase
MWAREEYAHNGRANSRITGTMSDANLRKAYKYKLKPTPEQAQALSETLWHCRTLYNTALEQRITLWKQRGVRRSRYEQEAELKALRADSLNYATIHSHVLQDVLARLDKTCQAFFRRVQAGEAPGLPRFQGRARYHSFTYEEYGNGARIESGYLVLSKIGSIALQWSRPLTGTPKTITISREADGWYVIVPCVGVPAQSLPSTGRETGTDVGLKVFLITADGLIVENSRPHRRGERQLKKAQQRVSRRKKGSQRRKKAVRCLARAHQHVKRQRADFHHKTALHLLRQYDTIYLEALRIANMVRNRHLAKSISDAGWARFRAILEAKAAYAGGRVIAVPAQYTSQDCSGCGERVPKRLSVRAHVYAPMSTRPCLRVLWSRRRPRRERGQKHAPGRACPSGTRGVACGDEPSIRRAASPCGVSTAVTLVRAMA